jgi:hypothetical protein
MRRNNLLLWSLSSTFRYIDDVLYINNNEFYPYVDLIYLIELKIKDTTECSTFASYLDILLKMDTSGKITTQLYDKRDDFQLHQHMVYISHS